MNARAAMRAPRMTGTAIAASFPPLLNPPAPKGAAPSAAAGGLLAVCIVPLNGPFFASRLADTRLTVPGYPVQHMHTLSYRCARALGLWHQAGLPRTQHGCRYHLLSKTASALLRSAALDSDAQTQHRPSTTSADQALYRYQGPRHIMSSTPYW